jgi:cation/acetate symporter
MGITVSIVVGVISALTLIILSPDMFKQFGWDPLAAPIPFNNPGIISIPLSFLTLVVVSLMTQKRELERAELPVVPEPPLVTKEAGLAKT